MARPRVAPSPRRRLRTLRQEESKRKGTQITTKNANDVRPVAARGLPSALLWHKAAASTRPFAFFAVICVPLRLNLRCSQPAGPRLHGPASRGPVVRRAEPEAVISPRILTGPPVRFGSIDDRP